MFFVTSQNVAVVNYFYYFMSKNSHWFAEMIANVLRDADQLQTTFRTLLTNQSEANVWTGHVVDSVVEIIQMIPKVF